MRLSDYLHENKISAYKFADDIGAAFQSVYKWMDGSRVPRKYAAAIAEYTKGKVMPNDFLLLPQTKHKSKR